MITSSPERSFIKAAQHPSWERSLEEIRQPGFGYIMMDKAHEFEDQDSVVVPTNHLLALFAKARILLKTPVRPGRCQQRPPDFGEKAMIALQINQRRRLE